MRLTDAQKKAVETRGNVLVSAAAGTGKTSTLVARCLHCLGDENASLDEILIVTFTEAAAAEMRERLRAGLEEKLCDEPDNSHWAEQLALFDAAHIGTLHSFCFKLIRQHFYELKLDPQLSVLDEGEARLLANESVEAVFQRHYEAQDERAEAVQQLIQNYSGGKGDQPVRALILRLHEYMQTRANPSAWFEQQFKMFAAPEPEQWHQWLLEGIAEWRGEWKAALDKLAPQNEKAAECLEILNSLSHEFNRDQAAEVLAQLREAGKVWPPRKKTMLQEPLEFFFEEAVFLSDIATKAPESDPLAEDWSWIRGHMATLLELAREFDEHFSQAKLEAGVADFHDLEQFALQLLWDFKQDKPTPIAAQWRKKIRFVLVDEYQDINAAQDKIIEALSRGGAQANRFLVGDAKQSIYRFRLADPAIFANYEKTWRGEIGHTLSLVENFRSREGVLSFINEFFALFMRPEFGGVAYNEDASLRFGAPENRRELSLAANPGPRAELLLRLKGTSDSLETESEPAEAGEQIADLQEADKEARLLAMRLKELKAEAHQVWDEERKSFRAVEWRDVAVLLRAPANKAESYAKTFTRAGVPLNVERGGFYKCSEVADLLNVLQLLNNPLQDVPAIAVLRSPLVGLSLNELAAIRLALPRGNFWTALVGSRKSEVGGQKVETFLNRFAHWRRLARQISLSRCLETVLVETHYEDWLRGQGGGEQQCVNVRQLINLACRFDEFQRQGLFRFLRFVEAQQEAEAEPEVPAMIEENAVRLMSIHQSKGLEFPVVAVADLGKAFNEADLRANIILDEKFGLCPQVKPPHAGGRYPSLPCWLARHRQKREMLGEELRLLYVAMTRARDTLILSAGISGKFFEARWKENRETSLAELWRAKSYSDWLGIWFSKNCAAGKSNGNRGETRHCRWRFHDDTELLQAEATAEKDAAPSSLLLDASELEKLRQHLSWEYPFVAAADKLAKTSVSVLRRRAAELMDEEAVLGFGSVRNSKLKMRNVCSADVGTAHHKFLERVSFGRLGSVEELRLEGERLKREKILSADEIELLDFDALAEFWQSEFGQKIRTQSNFARRELAFTARFSPDELAEIIGEKPKVSLKNDFVVVQGVADLTVILPKEIWLVDFKTDEVKGKALTRRTKDYEPQLKLYARALARIYQRPVTECRLHFLSRQTTVPIKVG